MIPLNIQRSDRGYVCSTDDRYSDVGLWLQYDLGPSGGGGVAEELFEDIGALRAGRKEQVEVWGDLLRVRIGKEGVVIQTMLTSRRRTVRSVARRVGRRRALLVRRSQSGTRGESAKDSVNMVKAVTKVSWDANSCTIPCRLRLEGSKEHFS